MTASLVVLAIPFLLGLGCQSRVEARRSAPSGMEDVVENYVMRPMVNATDFRKIAAAQSPDTDNVVKIRLREVTLEIPEQDYPGDLNKTTAYLASRGMTWENCGLFENPYMFEVGDMLLNRTGLDTRLLEALLRQGSVRLLDKQSGRYLEFYWMADFHDSGSGGVVFILPNRARPYIHFDHVLH